MNSVPTFVIEEHNEAFYIWNYCIAKGMMPANGNVLLHVDEHADMGVPKFNSSINELTTDPEEVLKFVQDEIGIGSFIVPSIYLGLFREISWIKVDQKVRSNRLYVRSYNAEGMRLLIGPATKELIKASEQDKDVKFFQYNFDITNIVLLDDQRRRFYIGDTYFWLLNIRKNLLSIFPNANIHIVCRNQLRFQIISKMLNGSWDHNITFEHKQWKQVDYSSYDLVLCDSDTLHDFLPFVKQHMSLFTKKQMYCYINTYIKSIEKFTAFNFKNLYDHHETKRNKVKHLLHLRKQSGLAITAEEHNWATEWLAGKGFDYQDNKLIVFVFNSSQQSKSLREDVMMHLTGHFASIKSYKVLLFDENREGLGHKCAEKLGEALYRNIIIFEGRGLRQAMALMAHPKVDLIIGPCTGLLHLANGVYNYLLNTGQRLRNHIPSLVVYMGDVKEYSTEYHPKDWWRNTLVKCFIFSKVGSFGRFKSLEDFQANGLDFLVDSMELSEASLENFIEIFTHHSLTNRKLLGQLMDTMC